MPDLRVEGPVPSPCIDVCTMDPGRGWCLGCLRTIDEIAAWGRLDETGRRAVVQQLPARRRSLAAATLEAAPPPRG